MPTGVYDRNKANGKQDAPPPVKRRGRPPKDTSVRAMLDEAPATGDVVTVQQNGSPDKVFVGVSAANLITLIESLEQVRDALTGIAALDAAQVQVSINERQVKATYINNEWLLDLA